MQTRTTDGTTRAKYVCRACSSRKKVCDKAFPTCGSCKKKNTACRYEIPLSKREGGRHRKHQPGKNFVVISGSPSSNRLWDDVLLNEKRVWTDPLGNVEAWSPPSLSSFSSPHRSIEENVHAYALKVLQATDITLDALGERYFRTFDTLIIILSHEHFHRIALSFKDTRTPPPICHSTLVLSMLLAVGLPDQKCNSQTTGLLDRTAVYMTTKAQVAQAQAITGVSLYLAQTMFLLAACEHLAGRPEVAYLSLTSCIGMTRMIEVEQTTTWAIAFMERIILCEIQSKNITPLTELPDINRPTQASENQSLPNPSQHAKDQTESAFQDSAQSSLAQVIQNHKVARQTQLVALVDRTLSLTRSSSLDITNAHSKINQLDREIHNFLHATLVGLEDITQSATHSSPTVALTFRILFLFHNAILEALGTSSQGAATAGEADHQRIKSLTSLDSACSMVLDVARHCKMDHAKTVTPICCFYNGKAAVEHLRKRRVGGELEGRHWDVEGLGNAEQRYWTRWCFEKL
ncbi:hypothetical protein DM02DRAFT_26507 [Periconia macrospinosa]|uniref:Zn(2)-C6 fungal-type domain-containing protein n=1 Tax=Periconia macrospinosa TaxID=97972 RepID=A0A2V1DMK3_9PLEO|nr:hypothetical protein DM02DRAFT_26507 [Periconia macrospinosa]